MPSKTRKQSKISSSRLSESEPSSSSHTSTATSTPILNSEPDGNDLSSCIGEASEKFPSFIGIHAFIGRVTDVESHFKGCKIWLSESSMIASSFAPGSICSVALAPSGKKFSGGCGLSSFVDECSAHFGVDCREKMGNRVGNYFVLATVFPSSKVLKNGVRLSLTLSYSMGSPASGRFVFIHPIHSGTIARSNQESDKMNSSNASYISLYSCKDLYLELVPSRESSMQNDHSGLLSKGCAGATLDRFGSSGVSSPQTPLPYESRLFSPSASMLGSASSKDSALVLTNTNGTNYDSFDIRETLKTKVQRNFCRVMGAKRYSAKEDITQIPGMMYDAYDALVVDHETKVHICLLSDSTSDTSVEGNLPPCDIKSKHTPLGHEILKLGGLWKEYAALKDILLSSANNALSSLGLRTTKGVLLHGPPGTGKTSLAMLCAHDSGINLFKVNGPEIISQYYGESEQALHDVFNSATQAAPSVIFIDELDAIAPARKEGGEELSQRMVATLLNLMDGISRTDNVLVIAATNRPEIIEPALRRPGRLDREIEIGVPSPDQRLDILVTLLNRMEHSLTHDQIQQLAAVTHGFVGADLVSLCNEAAMVCLRRYVKLKKSCYDMRSNRISRTCNGFCDGLVESSSSLNDLGESLSIIHANSVPSATADLMVSPNSIVSLESREETQEFSNNIQNTIAKRNTCIAALEEEEHDLKVGLDDFEKARMRVRPSAMREVILEVPKVKWEDVGGQQEVKRQLMEAVEWPRKHHDAFQRIGTTPPTGVLMFGPPGCSKTLMARAVASEAGLNFLAVKGPEMFSKWVGESEKAVRSIFAKARANAPSIIFFDEIDSLAVIRGKENDGVSVADRVMSQLLVEMDGLHQRVNVTVIAATNRPDKIDPALLRPGRFDRLLYVGPPNEADRGDIFRVHLRKIPCSADVDIMDLARLTEGCTGADISLICREAAIAAIEESLDASEIKMEHLKIAIDRVHPSEIQSYEEFSEMFQRVVYSGAQSDKLLSETEPRRSNWNPKNLINSIARLIYQIPAVLPWLKKT
ncbi:hypothetical protein Nepgr_022062 [Nepenthes gracilis]|uniref:AAA+ ATPase domain-containing protein n=1 Tax=Nepenthes gracilis TaxID=150966 RepID=A0AAD3XY10_NEPGR|nr:hypothetical protein Nepgr_022062 [Nepenthes gracilis]